MSDDTERLPNRRGGRQYGATALKLEQIRLDISQMPSITWIDIPQAADIRNTDR
jgi:hypothetical protein